MAHVRYVTDNGYATVEPMPSAIDKWRGDPTTTRAEEVPCVEPRGLSRKREKEQSCGMLEVAGLTIASAMAKMCNSQKEVPDGTDEQQRQIMSRLHADASAELLVKHAGRYHSSLWRFSEDYECAETGGVGGAVCRAQICKTCERLYVSFDD